MVQPCSRQRTCTSGFTLIELMIVIAIIAIVAALAIPDLLRERNQANETVAVASLRSLENAQITHFTNDIDQDTIEDFACSLGELCALGLIDDVLGAGQKSGYSFSLTSNDPEQTWSARANPVNPGATGSRYFYVDQTGVIRVNDDEPADSDDPALKSRAISASTWAGGKPLDLRSGRALTPCAPPGKSQPECGDGVLSCGEDCDDGNTFPGDGCEPDCTLSATKAGFHAGPTFAEQLDAHGLSIVADLDSVVPSEDAVGGAVALLLDTPGIETAILDQLDLDGDGLLFFGEVLEADLLLVARNVIAVLFPDANQDPLGPDSRLTPILERYQTTLATLLDLGVAFEPLPTPPVVTSTLVGTTAAVVFLNGSTAVPAMTMLGAIGGSFVLALLLGAFLLIRKATT